MEHLRLSYCLLLAGQHVWARYSKHLFLTHLIESCITHIDEADGPDLGGEIRHQFDRQLTFLEIKRKKKKRQTASLAHPLCTARTIWKRRCVSSSKRTLT